ncbi:MAG: C25 family cysteine peptidase [Candidatus Thermoplasmatota archaeon]
MKKNDKLIVILGVIVLITASVGVYYGTPQKGDAGTATVESFFSISGTNKNIPEAVEVSDGDPFNALIATPLTVHYNDEGKEIIPLYVKNYTNPSEAVLKIQEQYLWDDYKITSFKDSDYKSVEDFSLNVAEKYWKKTDAALIVENSKNGYALAVNAVPMASYLNIPVIVTEEVDEDVKNVLEDLQVEKVIVCGDVKGYKDSYRYLKYEDVDQVVDDSIKLITEKFGDVKYLAMANPIDAYPPKVLEYKTKYFGSESDWSFTIPNDYKYARVKIEAISEDRINFRVGANLEDIHPKLQEIELTDGGSSIPIRDKKGNIIKYIFYRESVVYGRQGVEYNIYGPTDESVRVTIEKIEHPVNPMMKGISTLAPYLAAYHQGMVFGKTDFAFTANDDLRDEDGEKIPGYYMPRYNPELTTLSNKHVYDNVHKPLNKVLSKIADVDIDERTYTKDIKYLQDYYSSRDFSIALVGGATVLPQYIYQNELEPFGDIDGDGVDDTAYNYGGGGTPSDVIYGNIDPVKYDWSNMAQDIYTELPQMENVVGRIVGWDAQDANALILRSIFYDDIIENFEGWKDNFAILIGGGVDHQKPLIPYKLEQWFGLFSFIENIVGSIPATQAIARFMDANGPWKYETGATELSGRRVKEKTAEAMGFEPKFALKSHAMIEGYTRKELQEIKNKNIIFKLLTNIDDLEEMVGEHVVKGGEYMEHSNYIFANAHGAIGSFGTEGPDLASAGFDIKLIPGKWIERAVRRITPLFGGWLGPSGTGLMDLGKGYTPTSVTGLDLGPSFMWLDSCTCGKIDGVHPYQSVSMALLHSGVGNLVASTTGSNIPGGYLPGKDKMYDTRFSVWKARQEWEKKAEQGIYPDPHFGFKMFEDTSHFLKEEDCSTGQAFKQMKNIYLPEDLEWQLWWTPPLSSGATQDRYGPHKPAKYTSYFEFTLYGDPAFNPYEPCNEGAS